MLNYLLGVNGPVTVNGVNYDTVQAALQDLQSKQFHGELAIVLGKSTATPQTAAKPANTNTQAPAEKIATADGTIYKIKVRQYMTKVPSAGFDFHMKWNNGVPVPMRVMVGRKLQETRGMVKMELWGQITEEETQICMKCGRTLTNPVSRFFGIGPECGGHNYVHPFETDEELRAAVKQQNEKLNEIKWTGWLIRSSIEEEEVLRNV
jgi:hypothetical protein